MAMGRCPPPQMGTQPGSPMSPLPPPMMPSGPGGPIMANSDHQVGGPMGSMRLLTHPPMHPGMGMPYGGAPVAGSVFHPAGMQSHGAPNAGVANTGAGGRLGGGDGQARGYPAMQQPPMAQMIVPFEPVTNPIAAAVAACQPMTTVTVGIPNSMIGAILGKGGSTISELQNMSGARINVSQRDELLPGTENRVLTICGTPMATHAAQYLVSQKIQEVSERPKRQALN